MPSHFTIDIPYSQGKGKILIHQKLTRTKTSIRYAQFMLPHSTIDVPYVNVKRQEKIEYIKNEKNQHLNKYLKSDWELYHKI